jgi:hypothetical protein
MPELDLKRTDFEPYFYAWNSVLHYPNPALPKEKQQPIFGFLGEAGMMPCHQHKTCGALVFASEKYPPKVCPNCQIDTSLEVDSNAQPLEPDPETGLVVATAYRPKEI